MTTLCDLLSIKHVCGRPSSIPKLTIDTEYIARASRALAAVTLVRQAAASEVAVSSGLEKEEWINEMDCWTSAGWMITMIVTVGILVYLVSTWWNAGKVAVTVSNSTQTLEEECKSQDIQARILIVRNNRTAHWKSDCPLLCRTTCNPEFLL